MNIRALGVWSLYLQVDIVIVIHPAPFRAIAAATVGGLLLAQAGGQWLVEGRGLVVPGGQQLPWEPAGLAGCREAAAEGPEVETAGCIEAWRGLT